MKKIVMGVTMAAIIGIGITSAAPAVASANTQPMAANCCNRGGNMGRNQPGGMMWDEDGNFLTREAFEARLNEWIADGRIPARNREFMLERFDWCADYGGGATGARGRCGGFGRRR